MNAPNSLCCTTFKYATSKAFAKGFLNVAKALSFESLYINTSTSSPTLTLFPSSNDFGSSTSALPSNSLNAFNFFF